MPVRVLVIGAGAVGGFYGGALARAGCKVSVVARSDYDVVREGGYLIQSLIGDFSFKPESVFRNAEECVEQWDYVLLSVKLVKEVDRLALLKPVVAERTHVVLLQNGIQIEDEVANAFSRHQLISAVAYVAVAREAPGRIRHFSPYTRLVLGNYPVGISQATIDLAELMNIGGINCQTSADIVRARWEKCAWNAVFNPISALGGGIGTRAILASEESRQLAREAMMEVCAIARSVGYELPADFVEKQFIGTSAMPDFVCSMGQDLIARRPMETEALVGNAVRIARRLSVPIPKLETLYAQLLDIEQGQPTRR